MEKRGLRKWRREMEREREVFGEEIKGNELKEREKRMYLINYYY